MKRGTIKATVLIETILAAFEMDAIIHELREHCVGLNCGRWDYIFSFIKKFRNRPDFLLPDRGRVTMDRHFLKSYVDLLIKTCHRRGAHAMGGMAALEFRSATTRRRSGARTGASRQIARSECGSRRHLGRPPWIGTVGAGCIQFCHCRDPISSQVARQDVQCYHRRTSCRCPQARSPRTDCAVVSGVGVQYIEAWLRGNGCVPLYNLMEDAATAEICRAQLWQAVHHGARTSDGRLVSEGRFDGLLTDELDRIQCEVGATRLATGVFPTAARLFAEMIQQDTFDEFLTLPAYEHLT